METISIVHISDTHNDYSFNAGSGDILIHSGDATRGGTLSEIQKLRDYFFSIHKNFKHIIFTPGNHDFLFAEDYEASIKEFKSIPNLQIVINKTITLMGLKFFISPYSELYGSWCFMDTNENLAKIWDKIEKDTDIVVTHCPPFGELDHSTYINLGSNSLKWKIEQIKPKAHLFGHIHESWGFKKSDGIWYVNSALGPTLRFINEQFPHKILIDKKTKEILEISPVE